MSGVDVSKDQKEKQVHTCELCMNTVVHSLGHFQEQIANLKRENAKLHGELENTKEEQKEQKRILKKKIRALEKKVAELYK